MKTTGETVRTLSLVTMELAAARKDAWEAHQAIKEASAPWRWVLRAWSAYLNWRVAGLMVEQGRLRLLIRAQVDDLVDGHRAGRRQSYRDARKRDEADGDH